jgi:hypothetical protein
MIKLMNAGGREIRDTGIINTEVRMRWGREKQGGQQEDGGWVMIQRVCAEGTWWAITR